MEFKDLREETQKAVKDISKYASSTIRNDLEDALEEAKTEEELKDIFWDKMEDLYQEAKNEANLLKQTVEEGNKPY
jgi:truncated hemoglobin YjbI